MILLFARPKTSTVKYLISPVFSERIIKKDLKKKNQLRMFCPYNYWDLFFIFFLFIRLRKIKQFSFSYDVPGQTKIKGKIARREREARKAFKILEASYTIVYYWWEVLGA